MWTPHNSNFILPMPPVLTSHACSISDGVRFPMRSFHYYYYYYHCYFFGCSFFLATICSHLVLNGTFHSRAYRVLFFFFFFSFQNSVFIFWLIWRESLLHVVFWYVCLTRRYFTQSNAHGMGMLLLVYVIFLPPCS